MFILFILNVILYFSNYRSARAQTSVDDVAQDVPHVVQLPRAGTEAGDGPEAVRMMPELGESAGLWSSADGADDDGQDANDGE